MNVLMLTPRFPFPPNRGDTLRSWHELEYLTRRHNVWLAGLNEHRPPESDIARLRKICAAVAVFPRTSWRALAGGLWSLLCGESLTQGYFHSDALNRTVRQWTRAVRFDAVLTFTIAMASVAEEVRARRVLDMCDVDSCKWEAYARASRVPWRWLYRVEAARLRRAERRGVRTHDVTLIVNQREHDKLQAVADPRLSDVVHTCVELPAETRCTNTPRTPEMPAEPIVGFVGSMFYPPNVQGVNWFGREAWPRIKKRVPAAKWWIVGQRPTFAVRRWDRLQDVRVTGTVPDVNSLLDRMRVFACPVRGDLGVQSKVLGALAAGKACVVTPDAAAGIDYDEPPFLIAQDAEEFAEAVTRLFVDDDLARELGARGRQTIARRYRPETQLWRVERALASVPARTDDARSRLEAETRIRNENVRRVLQHAAAEESKTRA